MAAVKDKPDAAVVLLISNSGTVLLDELAAAKNASIDMVNSFPSSVDVSFGIVLFSAYATSIPFSGGQYLSSNKAEVISAISSIQRATNRLVNLYSGIEESQKILESYEGPRNIVIIAEGVLTALPEEGFLSSSDFVSNGYLVYVREETIKKIEEVHQNGINLFVVIYGLSLGFFFAFLLFPLYPDYGEYFYVQYDMFDMIQLDFFLSRKLNDVLAGSIAVSITDTAIEAATYDVTFIDWNGDELSETQRVVRGDAARAPPDPTRVGWMFTGWDFDFSKVTADLIVTAQYTECEYVAVVTAPTCTDGGFTTYTCAGCGDWYVDEEVGALGHDYVPVVTVTTCTAGGFTTFTCSRCDDSYVDDIVPAFGHDYEAVVTAPTCTDDGFTTYTCTVCDDKYDTVDKGSAVGHDWGAPKWDGEWQVVCSECGEVDYITYDCNEYGCQRFVENATAPTCTDDGFTTYTCIDCGTWYFDDEVDSPGHDYRWDYTDPTCTEDGYWTCICSVCGDVVYETEGSAFGHEWSEPVWDGEEWYVTCGVCGESEGIIYDCEVYGCQRYSASSSTGEVGIAVRWCEDCGKPDYYELDYDDANVVNVHVEKLTGNQNRLWITVVETYGGLVFLPIQQSFMIPNNAAGTYTVGNTKVYVDTKGNTQIRAVSIVP